MRKGIIIAVSVLSGLLAACSNQGSTSSQPKSSSSSKVAKSKSSSVGKLAARPSVSNEHSTSQKSGPWNDEKSQQLSSFMDSWGTTMKQEYDSYGPNNNTDFYGLKYPAQFKKDNLMANNQAATFAWSDNGKGPVDYEVVAIYSDSEHENSMGSHLYLFTLHKGEPVVLITEQNQGNEENKVYFKTTENTDLADGFSKIVNGQSATTSTKSQKTTTKDSSSDSNKPKPYDISSAMQGTWYSVDDKGKMTKTTFTAHTITFPGAGDKPYTSTWYMDDDSDPDDRSNVHNDWDRVGGVYNRDGIELINVRGWNQSAGAGSYYGVKQETVNGKSTDVLISAGGADVLCYMTSYRTAAMAKQQGTKKFDDITYDED
ncbi:DUF4767 domain-containing protein [Lactiplantibacillus paraxiangfangensis]|uniref:DUF4767 domain-containing protein n=1 Tax=Lactiplantibacillus paraxiangfangensis TaxID=3076224 RepID=UPI0030C71715